MNKRQAKKQSLHKKLLYEHRKLDKKYFRALRKNSNLLDDMRIFVLRQQILKEMESKNELQTKVDYRPEK